MRYGYGEHGEGFRGAGRRANDYKEAEACRGTGFCVFSGGVSVRLREKKRRRICRFGAFGVGLRLVGVVGRCSRGEVAGQWAASGELRTGASGPRRMLIASIPKSIGYTDASSGISFVGIVLRRGVYREFCTFACEMKGVISKSGREISLTPHDKRRVCLISDYETRALCSLN